MFCAFVSDRRYGWAAARATALVQLAQDMPPAVLAAMLGLHLNTVRRGRSRAVTDWTAYLQARASSRAAPHLDYGTSPARVNPKHATSNTG